MKATLLKRIRAKWIMQPCSFDKRYYYFFKKDMSDKYFVEIKRADILRFIKYDSRIIPFWALNWFGEIDRATEKRKNYESFIKNSKRLEIKNENKDI